MLQDKIDSKVLQIFNLLEQGQDRDAISDELGYKNHKSLDAYLRRNGYMWDKRFQRYVSKIDGTSPLHDDVAQGSTGKPREIILAISRGNSDIKELARHYGFRDHRELADYMTTMGYSWDSYKSNYYLAKNIEKETINEVYIKEENIKAIDTEVISKIPVEKEVFLDFLYEHRDKLMRLLDETVDDTMPQYLVPGLMVTKSVHMTNLLDQMIRDFSTEKNIKQRVIFEVALIDFFKKYGYGSEVSRMLK